MSIIVQKYGGTSVGNIEKIYKIADKVIAKKKEGHKLAVIVSAMAGETDRLIKLSRAVTNNPAPREYDVLVSTGEQVSCALMSMALQSRKQAAESLLAHQVHIHTDQAHSKAEILQVDAMRIKKCIEQDKVAVVAGFQGLNSRDDITTLGRGGSDLTAIAVAISLSADICQIFTNVRGVYTADPAICPKARLIERISYEEMLELASLGAKVLQARSVKLAMKFNLPIQVLSSFENGGGTIVTKEDRQMERRVVSGVASDKSEAKITLRKFKDTPEGRAQIFGSLAEAGILVDMIIQNISEEGEIDLSFTVPRDECQDALKIVENLKQSLAINQIISNQNIVKVSVVGVGMRSHSGVAADLFRALAEENISVQMISTSEIKISCVIEEKDAERAVRAIHQTFELGSNNEVCG